MALTTAQKEEIEKAAMVFLESHRPPEHIREKLDIAYRIEGQSVLIYQIRPRFDEPSIKLEIPIAKTTYVKIQNHWKIFWMRADAKWHGYEPHPTVKMIDDFFNLVAADKYGCFFG
jgi:hypothetical protein